MTTEQALETAIKMLRAIEAGKTYPSGVWYEALRDLETTLEQSKNRPKQ